MDGAFYIAKVGVSIPMTVLGGLQFSDIVHTSFLRICFNTDDGIRRAAILKSIFGRKIVQMFQYR